MAPIRKMVVRDLRFRLDIRDAVAQPLRGAAALITPAATPAEGLRSTTSATLASGRRHRCQAPAGARASSPARRRVGGQATGAPVTRRQFDGVVAR